MQRDVLGHGLRMATAIKLATILLVIGMEAIALVRIFENWAPVFQKYEN